MAIRVLTFDPLNANDVTQFERDLDTYLREDWEVLTTISGNRAGVAWGKVSPFLSKVRSPEYKDYVVFVLRHVTKPQAEMPTASVAERPQ